MNRIFSGIQPTGNLHLGNYLGAMRNWVALQNDFDCIFCVVDLHAITVWQNPDELRASTREVAAAMIAAGVEPEKNILFTQSQNPCHAELAWIFNCVARMGWLNRMTQFKEKAGKNRENASVGLFAYPNLMAADILAYKATHVPVGDDQKQHLELARDIAQKFNNDFGRELFPIIEPVIMGEATRVMSLRDGTSKMSKSDPSDNSRINMVDDVDAIVRKIRKAKTDPKPLPQTRAGLEDRPEAANLMTIFAALTDTTMDGVVRKYAGQPFSVFKQDLADAAVENLAPIQNEMRRLVGDPEYVDRVLSGGAARAREISEPIIREIHDVLGFLNA